MNLEELKQIIDRTYQHLSYRNPSEIQVRIPVMILGSVGHIPCVEVKSANLGFDWEAGSFLIHAEKSLREIDRDEAASLRKNYEELGWSKYRIDNIKRENTKLKKEIKALKAEKLLLEEANKKLVKCFEEGGAK